ncbi:HIT family protein [Natronorubrum sp. FCH18a]|uniref:HIT family protein n=1 Tax=Natronorubrum sp. FCH18a TaxID=3447018 RepID=UPI003F513134
MNDECEFCRIVAGDRSAHVLYEDDRTVAFLDANPAVRGHSLVVPRVHEQELLAVDDAMAPAVFESVRIVANALETVLDPDGFSVFHTSGPLVGTVDHAHVHLLPRIVDDDVSLSLSRDRLEADDASALATRVRESV